MTSSTLTPPRRLRAGRVPALVLAASLAVGGTVAFFASRDGDTPSPSTASRLPDPVEQARASIGTPPIADTVAFWQRRADAAPNDLPNRRFLAGSLMTQASITGDLALYERAEAEWREAMRISPGSADAALGLAGALAAQHRFADAAALANDVLARDAESVPARIALGDAQFELGRYAAAEATYEELASAIPGTATLSSRRARVAALHGDADGAVRHARAALVDVGEIDLAPGDAAFFWFQLASYELAAGRVEAADSHLARGLQIDPDHLPSLELQAQVSVEQGRLRLAERRYERLVRDSPAADIFGLLAKVEVARGDRAAARRHVAEGIALGREQLGRFPAERRHLASFFADVRPRAGLAAARADYAERQDIQSAGILAWAEYRTGDLAAAVRHSREALRFGTADAVLQAQGGLIEADAGNDRRARRLLRSALDLRPDYDLEWAPKARARLRALTAG